MGFIKKSYLLIFWFFPILITAATERLSSNGQDWIVVYLLLMSVGAGALYCTVWLNKTGMSVHFLLVAMLIFGSMLLSDLSEFKLVLVLAAYSAVVHLLSREYSSLVWNQYYYLSVAVSFFAVVDIVWFFYFDSFLFSYREPRLVGGMFPRINTIFDEMSHQAFFLMPALLVAYKNNEKYFVVLLVGVLSTFSVSALLLYFPLLVIYGKQHDFFSVKQFSVLMTAFAAMVLIIVIGGGFIASKLSHVFDTDVLIGTQKNVSASNIILAFDLARNMSFHDFLFGYGYFSQKDELQMYLLESDLVDYYVAVGLFDDPVSVGIFNMVLYFGFIILVPVMMLIYKARIYSADRFLYVGSLLVVILSMLKNSHTVDYFVHLFFVFGLAWSSSIKNLKKSSVSQNG